MVKNLPASAGDLRAAGSIPGSGRSPAGRHGDSLRYSEILPCLNVCVAIYCFPKP